MNEVDVQVDIGKTAAAVQTLLRFERERRVEMGADEHGQPVPPIVAFAVTSSAAVNESMAAELSVDAVLKLPLRKLDLLGALSKMRPPPQHAPPPTA
jgi:hypothetical protein